MVTAGLATVLAAALTASDAHADCVENAEEVVMALESAERAFEERDKAAVREAGAEARQALPCVRETITPGLAARYHRVEGLVGFLDKDDTRAGAAFGAARLTEPGFVLPSTWAPQGHPLQGVYTLFDLEAASHTPVPVPGSGRLHLDGRQASERYTDLPAVLQVFDDAGAVTATSWLPSGAPVPYVAPAPIAASSTLPGPEVSASPRSGPNRTLLGSALAGVLISGALYGGAAVVGNSYDALEQTPENAEQFETLYTRNHRLVISAGVTAGVSAGLGAGAFMIGRK